jgi:hypothetical protein
MSAYVVKLSNNNNMDSSGTYTTHFRHHLGQQQPLGTSGYHVGVTHKTPRVQDMRVTTARVSMDCPVQAAPYRFTLPQMYQRVTAVRLVRASVPLETANDTYAVVRVNDFAPREFVGNVPANAFALLHRDQMAGSQHFAFDKDAEREGFRFSTPGKLGHLTVSLVNESGDAVTTFANGATKYLLSFEIDHLQ